MGQIQKTENDRKARAVTKGRDEIQTAGTGGKGRNRCKKVRMEGKAGTDK